MTSSKRRRLPSGTDPSLRVRTDQEFLTAVHRLRQLGFVAQLATQVRFIPNSAKEPALVACLRYKNGTQKSWYPLEAIWFAFLRKPGQAVIPGESVDPFIPFNTMLGCHLALQLRFQAATEAYAGYDPVLRAAVFDLAGFPAGTYRNLY